MSGIAADRETRRAHPRAPGLRRARWIPSAALAIALALAPAPGARAEGIVSEATTAALLEALEGGGRVQLTFTQVLTLQTPLLIATDTVLEGSAPGGERVTISGGDRHRLLEVLPGVTLHLRNLNLQDGLATHGAGILNRGVLIASNIVFSGCRAVGADGADGERGEDRFGIGGKGRDGADGGPAMGGAVYNEGSASLVDCTFVGNEAQAGSGGDGGEGGTGTILHGSGGDGGNGAHAFGGAVSSAGPLEVLRAVFASNIAAGGDGGAGGAGGGGVGPGQGGAGGDAAGGAIHASGWLFVAESAFATNLVTGGNSSSGGAPAGNIGEDGPDGGNAVGGAIAAWGDAVIVNSTFFTNLLVGGTGGDGGNGSFISGSGGDGGHALGGAVHSVRSLWITNATMAYNSGTNGAPGTAGSSNSGRDGRPGTLAGSAVSAQGGSAFVINSILASAAIPTVHGNVTDGGHNLFTDAGTGAAGPGSIRGAEPLLGEYRVWTSGTPGMIPLSGSPAIDAGDPDAAPPRDQRGVERPIGLGPDIGALESSGSLFTLAGRVLDGSAGLPGVTVRANGRDEITDGQGAFEFDRLPPGYYTVEPVPEGRPFTPRLVQVALFGHRTDLEFRVVALRLESAWDADAGVLRLTGTGTPLGSYRLEGSRDLAEWVTLGTATADPGGRITFSHSPGTDGHWFYRLAAP